MTNEKSVETGNIGDTVQLLKLDGVSGTAVVNFYNDVFIMKNSFYSRGLKACEKIIGICRTDNQTAKGSPHGWQ